jgi:hypothetical protein
LKEKKKINELEPIDEQQEKKKKLEKKSTRPIDPD